ncbi:hypothetical protein COT75_04845 [Candidatus Beckwithbacteria bacterium CG10_big_fil_rev_8_21_14_0_10_34_10]|uniref:Cation-transporting P-type ATPase N-terminal domain-containing protein n=1 Tax=Candidatus Beckwithbacteria bacterium CG10_big_fil_rev_8_21_14_0_10_34_10 TaxID=1974495 RepID=A0A2H0W7Y7_9BACT|nr:MAG: hypothetical protein COT75_04845 [Candidatus Beckwithbacteria bacterium CG10_big_fil_rev_8_21_14_0_10_34_10]
MDKSQGLTFQEAKTRLNKHGFNEIERKKQLSLLKLLLDQFKSPLIYILFFAGLITLFLKEWTDSVVIFLAVGVNTILGFIQEFKAEKSLVALRKMIVIHTKVIRDGKEELIEAKNIVPGDLVVLSTGDKVPADGLIIKEVDLHISEAILTGESIPVEKRQLQNLKEERDEIKPQFKAFMGTVVVSGRGRMLVTATGMKAKMGQLAGKLKETIDEETPLKKQITKLSRFLAIIFALICLIIFFEGILRQRPWLEMFTLSVAVAVAAIPEGLVIALTVILTLGMQKILKRKGLVRKLLAAETLGSVDVICADKTGTLTEGKMKVVGADFINLHQGKKAAVLCNNLINPLEIAMMDWVSKENKNTGQLIKENPRIAEIPFSSEKKFIAVLTSLNNSKDRDRGEIFLSGAPEMVMEMVPFSSREKLKWMKKLDEYTKKGLRVVAFASRAGDLERLKLHFNRLKKDFKKYDGHVDGNWHSLKLEWLGLLLFEDPVRLEVKKSLAECQRAGIKVKIITGDYKNTALAVLRKLGLADGSLKEDQAMEGWQLEKISSEELLKKIDKVLLFSRTTPEQKIRIVEALQNKGHTVAMMGDGVNDVLALKKSDIGIVVNEASEVAKETADIVLLDSNFQTIVAAVEEGRGIFENIKKVVLFLLSDSFTEVILIGGSLLLGLPVPLFPAQILWVNLVEDGLPGLALAFEPKDDDLMKELPRKKGTPIIDKEIKVIIFIVGIMTDLFLFGIFIWLLKQEMAMEKVRTIVFAGLAINSLLYVFSCKTLRKNIWNENLFNNKFLIFSVFFGFLLLISGIYLPLANRLLKTVPLNISSWFIIIGLGVTNVLLIELVKWFFLRNKSKIKSNSLA